LATSSAISGTVFGSSRQMSVIAKDGYFPNWLSLERIIAHKMQLSEWRQWQLPISKLEIKQTLRNF